MHKPSMNHTVFTGTSCTVVVQAALCHHKWNGAFCTLLC